VPDEAAATRAAATRVGLERVVRIGPRGLDRRQHTDQQTTHQSEPDAPREHPDVQRRLEAQRLELTRNKAARTLEAHPHNHETDCSAGQCEQQAFGEQQSRQPPARRAERQAHGELALTR